MPVDIFERAVSGLSPLGVKSKCCGGGRIEHDPSSRFIQVYGYSQGYGRADHSTTTEILKKEFPGYTIEWTNEGY